MYSYSISNYIIYFFISFLFNKVINGIKARVKMMKKWQSPLQALTLRNVMLPPTITYCSKLLKIYFFNIVDLGLTTGSTIQLCLANI